MCYNSGMGSRPAHSRPRPELFEDKAKANMNRGQGHSDIILRDDVIVITQPRPIWSHDQPLWLNTCSTGAGVAGRKFFPIAD